MTLYEITGELLELMEMAQDDVLDSETIADTLSSVEGEFEDKADGYAKVIRTLQGDVDSIQSEIERLEARKKTIKTNIDRLKQALENAMKATGKRKFKTALFGFGIQRNPPHLDVLDDESVPERFWVKQPDKLDRMAALRFIKKNGEQEWGRAVSSEGLRIK